MSVNDEDDSLTLEQLGIAAIEVSEQEQQEESGVDESGVEVSGVEESGVEEQAQEGAEEGEEEEEAGARGMYNADEVNDQIFDELHLPEDLVNEVQGTWSTFLKSADSREAAGEAIYAALFDSAPSLQSLFKTPRAVMAMRFMTGLNQIILSLQEPKAMKIVVETLGFQHLDLEVTPPRVVIFRDAIVDLLFVEMGARFSKKAREGWRTFLNYVGGSYIYVRAKFAIRLRILHSSWAIANNKANEFGEGEEQAADNKEEENKEQAGKGSGETRNSSGEAGKGSGEAGSKEEPKDKRALQAGPDKEQGSGEVEGSGEGSRGSGEAAGSKNVVPTSYKEMFNFNAAVMGFRASAWMSEVLASFDSIVLNVANSYRLQEECDVLSLRIAKYTGGEIKLPEYKAVMLATLRSLVPKDWNSDHEVAWSWLWDNVERMLKNLMGKPAIQERALEKFLASLDEETRLHVRREVFTSFFTIAPSGMDYFKQSTTRLHFIADKVVAMTLDMYKDPKRMSEDISALGLRHVGYGIPTDLFGAFVTGCVEVIRKLTTDDNAVDAFRWSLSLVSRMLTRVINEGSTIVMKAINTNSGKQLKKAVGCAPRGKRALWMLNIQVGTQSISPLLWSIETGGLEAAKAIIVDLLTIRADRERYYYGMDSMFERHSDIIKLICTDARGLLPILLDGLIWRSRTTEYGQRRVNYYIKHLLVDAEGDFAPAIEWVTENRDPKIVCHPVLALVTDLVWNRVALRSFLLGKLWFLLTLVIFLCSQSILNHMKMHSADDSAGLAPAASGGHRLLAESGSESDEQMRFVIFACRCFIYVCSMEQLIYTHCKHIVKDIKAHDYIHWGPVRLPAYLSNWQDSVGFALMVIMMVMLALEPIMHCIGKEGPLFNEHCEEGKRTLESYSVLSAVALLCYYLLLVDLAVLHTRISAFVLVCGRLLSEVALFLLGMAFFALAFASAVSALEQDSPNFVGIHNSALLFIKITFAMLGGEHYDELHDYPVLFVAVIIYVVATVVFLLNLLIAQLSCAYQTTYEDMLGYARLNRGRIVTETMPAVPRLQWQRFIGSLRLDERVEFGEGDLGLSGGIQIFEPANANIVTVDAISRFGGSTSPAAQWPEETAGNEEEDRLERMERQIERSIKLISTRRGGKKQQDNSSLGHDSAIDDSAGQEESGADSEK